MTYISQLYIIISDGRCYSYNYKTKKLNNYVAALPSLMSANASRGERTQVLANENSVINTLKFSGFLKSFYSKTLVNRNSIFVSKLFHNEFIGLPLSKDEYYILRINKLITSRRTYNFKKYKIYCKNIKIFKNLFLNI